MRCDVISIFPEYLEPLSLSLPGQAQRKGLLEVVVHDLRDFAHDRHHTVDDTPYGGGAGMVMKAQPWWEALEHVRTLRPGTPTLIVPGPGGEVLTQQLARELAQQEWLVFACGRYEGIDERVYEAAAEVMPVRVISLGDYVLNGGEVAVLAMIEASARLLPGFMGNAESLVEESHEDGLLEYPVYTKPASWRGRDVPDVLLSGDHGRVAAWRYQQRLERTAARRPDLLHVSAAVTPEELRLQPAVSADAGELLTLARACRLTRDDVTTNVQGAWVVRAGGRLVAAVWCAVTRDREADDAEATWRIGPLVVAPDLGERGLAAELLKAAEGLASGDIQVVEFDDWTEHEEAADLLRRAKYRRLPDSPAGATRYRKRRRR